LHLLIVPALHGRENKTLKGTIADAIPGVVGGQRLIPIDALHSDGLVGFRFN
jgi:hypothetical protein